MNPLVASWLIKLGLFAWAANAFAAAQLTPLNAPADLRPAHALTTTAQPSVAVSREGTSLRLTFTGFLLTAPGPAGPWSPITQASSPWLIPAEDPNPRFFRTTDTPPAATPLFSARTVLDLHLSAPLQPHFDLAFAGMPDGIFPPHREKPDFEGTVQIQGQDVPGKIRVRGNSSLQECPFPKLKLKIRQDDSPDTPFADAREIKIGTHCADGGSGTVGRLRHESAAYREALAYEAMAVLGFVSPRVRRARIAYTDTSPSDGANTGGWTLERQAFLLEHIEVLGARLGGRALEDEEIAALKDAQFDPQLIADLRLFHALLGNWDFALSETGEGLWNTEVIALAQGSLLPVPGDFDLASWVTGVVRLNAPHDFRPDLPKLERETAFQVGEVRKRVGERRFATARSRFLAHRAALEEWVDTATVDAAGRTNARHHLTAFFDALGTP